MTEMTDAIMDAAERRMREAGYNGFSFREIAADVGIRSASVHYHFATKAALAAAIARRYSDRFLRAVDGDIARGQAPVEAWVSAFGRALRGDSRMCLCGVLGVSALDLPAPVRQEARRFFQSGLDQLVAHGLSRTRALQVLSGLEGGMLLALALDAPEAFDAAIAAISTTPGPVARQEDAPQ